LIVGTLVALRLGFPAAYLLEGIPSMMGRMMLIGLVLAVVGFVLGCAFPLGVRMVAPTGEWAVQKMWAINGAASIAASVLAAFIGLMNFLSFSAQYIGISDARQPFGLPDGSVRAILTIAFIVLVGVLASYLLTHSDVRQPFAKDKIQVATKLALPEAVSMQQRLSAEGLAAVVPSEPGGTTYNVDFYPRQDYRLSDDVSKQVLTMLSTILAAMIGFYFGARTDGGAKLGEPEERLRIVAELNTLATQAPTIETVRASAAVKLRLDPSKKQQIDDIVKEIDGVQKKLDDAQTVAGDQSAPMDKVRTARDEAKTAVARLKDIDDRIKNL